MLSSLQTPDEIKTVIQPDSPLFHQLEYDLKYNLHSSTARLVQVWMLSNPHLSDQFSRQSHEQLTLPSWIDSKELVGGNTEEDVLKRGFQFISPKKGMQISVGSFSPGQDVGVYHKALLCEVLVGRSYTIDRNQMEDTELPPGYSSFYIQPSDDTSRVLDPQRKEYYHEYYIKNPLQVMPRYLIHYEYDEKLEAAARQKPKCDDCEKELATVYCEADKAYLCKLCDANLHKTKIARMHVRKAIGEGVDVFGMCKTHPTRQVQYFCSQCHEPVCIDCTILGSHSKVEEGKHALVSIEEYFRTVMEECKLQNPHLNERRVAINDQIGNIQSRADAVVQMGQQITTKIDEICAAAKKECNDIILKKLTVLNGDEHELRRQIGEIDRLENFLKYQQDGDFMNCVSTWHLHQQCREKLYDFRFFRQDIDVQLDAKINGRLNVIVDQDKTKMSQPNSTTTSPLKKPALPHRAPSPPLALKDRSIMNHYTRQTPVPAATPGNNNQSFFSPSAPLNYGVSPAPPRMPSSFGKMKLNDGAAMAHQLGIRKVERRTSDFFHEVIGMAQGIDDDFDSYSQISSRQ